MKKRWKKYIVFMLAGMLAVTGTAVPGVCAASPDAGGSVLDQPETDGTQDGSRADSSGPDNGADDPGSADPDADTGVNGTANGQDEPDMNDAESGAGQNDAAGGPGQAGDAGVTEPDDFIQDGSGDEGNDADKTVHADIEKDQTDVKADISIEDEDDDNVVIRESDKPYLALGANLSQEQKNAVLNLMGIDPANLEQYHVVAVTNEEEHQYLDGYLNASTIGTRALSSVVIVKRDKGEGIHISTKNITYCTVGMYKNALATAGLEDADVIVAGPFPLSGTAALIGAMKAYADMEDEEIDAESLDAAMNEIVVTGELNESLGDDVETEEFIAYVKQKVVESGLQDKEKIQEVISDACSKFKISLSDDEKEQITALMKKIGSLDIDVDSLIKQAGSIYESLKNMEGSSGFFGNIIAFFKRLLEAIIEFLKGLFG